MTSRQRAWQLRQVSLGNCQQCGKTNESRALSNRCEACRELSNGKAKRQRQHLREIRERLPK